MLQHKEIVSKFTTTEHGNTIISTLKEILCDYLIMVTDYYEKNNLDFKTYDKKLFKKELNVSLHGLPKIAKDYVAEVLHLTCDYYFQRDLPKLLTQIAEGEIDVEKLSEKLCLPDTHYSLSKGKPCYFIFTCLALTLSVDVSLSNIKLNYIHIVQDRLHLGIQNVN